MYSVVMPCRVGVVCKGCGRMVEVEDEYVRGVSGVETAAAFYRPVIDSLVQSGRSAWRKTLTCDNPGCGRSHEYTGGDLRLYGGAL